MFLHPVNERTRWLIFGHGMSALACARPHQRRNPSLAEVTQAAHHLGRQLPDASWAIQVEATQDEVVSLMEADKALLVCLRSA